MGDQPGLGWPGRAQGPPRNHENIGLKKKVTNLFTTHKTNLENFGGNKYHDLSATEKKLTRNCFLLWSERSKNAAVSGSPVQETDVSGK